jgi:hypothetical protein
LARRCGVAARRGLLICLIVDLSAAVGLFPLPLAFVGSLRERENYFPCGFAIIF